MSHGRRRGAWQGPVAAVCVCALAGCLLGAPAATASPDGEAQATLDRSVRFLQEAQNADGGFGGRRGAPSDPDFSAWAAYALAAASINPQDQAQPGGIDVFTYLAEHTGELRETTDFDRVALVALASGTSPDAFGGADPANTILSRQLADGSFAQQAGLKTGWINATIWSIFPLSAVHTPAAEEAVGRAASWLLAQQRSDGSWGSTTASSASDADMVGAAIEALVDARLEGREGERASAATDHALEFLAGQQGPDGGFRESPGSATNSATTAWVLQGMWAAGSDPRGWRTAAGSDPLSYLASLQRADGSIGWTVSDDTNSLWMTAQVGPALAGRTYPLAAVPREAKAPPPPAEPQRPPRLAGGQRRLAPHGGHGGVSSVGGEGVIAGGGGRGAPLFSAPQPQSTGTAPHGARAIEAVSGAAPERSAEAGAGGRSGAGASRGFRRARGSGGVVEGLVVGDRGSAAAPGLLAADSGGRSDPLVVALLAAALLGAAAIGSRRERAGMRLS